MISSSLSTLDAVAAGVGLCCEVHVPPNNVMTQRVLGITIPTAVEPVPPLSSGRGVEG